MRAAWTIAIQTLRQAVRSRLVFALALVLLFVTVFLPLTLRGDGTTEGLVRLVIVYTLSVTRFLLAVTAIWCGCAAVAGDIAERPLYLILTKPVRPLSIWLGKWLGLGLLLTALLAASAITLAGMLTFSLARAGVSAEELRQLNEEVLVSRTILSPERDGHFAEEAGALYTEKKASGEIPEGVTEAQARAALEELLVVQANQLGAGQSRLWRFRLPDGSSAKGRLHLRYTVMAPGIGALSTEGRWDVLDGRGKVLHALSATQTRGLRLSLLLPSDSAGADGFITLRYTNTDPEGHTVIFPPDSPPELLLRTGSFAGNYVRVVLILLIQLLFWTAIGVTAGCFFSQPVAVIFTGWLVLLSHLGGYLGTLSREYHLIHGNPEHRVWNLLAGPLYLVLHQVVRPLQSAPVLERLPAGEQVEWWLVARELGISWLLYGSLLALLGAWILKRREIGLPGKGS